MYMCAPHLCSVLKKLEDSVTFCGMAVQTVLRCPMDLKN